MERWSCCWITRSVIPISLSCCFRRRTRAARGTLSTHTNYAKWGGGGTYIAVCDGDDYWSDPLKLQKQADALNADPGCSLVYTDAITNYVSTGEYKDKIAPDPAPDAFTQLLGGNFITASTIMFRSEYLPFVDFDAVIENKFRMTDYPILLEMSNHGSFRRVKGKTTVYEVNKKEHASLRSALEQSIGFDENTTKIKLYFKRKYPNNTPLTEQDLFNAHYRRGIKYGLHLQDRLWVAGYLDKIVSKTRYEKTLSLICKSDVLFKAYQRYRKGKGIESDLNGLVYS